MSTFEDAFLQARFLDFVTLVVADSRRIYPGGVG
jgi:hypothetical protein